MPLLHDSGMPTAQPIQSHSGFAHDSHFNCCLACMRRTLAYLPQVHRPLCIPISKWPVAKRALLAKASGVSALLYSMVKLEKTISPYTTYRLNLLPHAQVVLDSFKTMSKEGVVLKDPNGTSCLAFPRLAAYAADTPEQKEMLGMRQGEKCAQPCHKCEASHAPEGWGVHCLSFFPTLPAASACRCPMMP